MPVSAFALCSDVFDHTLVTLLKLITFLKVYPFQTNLPLLTEFSWWSLFFLHLAVEPETSVMVLCRIIQAALCFPASSLINILFSSTTVSVESVSVWEVDIHMQINLYFWNICIAGIIPLSWLSSHSGHILSELVWTDEAHYILTICHVTGSIWMCLKLIRLSDYSPTQKLCIFCSFAGPLGVAAIIHFECREIKTAIKKKKYQMTQFFI